MSCVAQHGRLSEGSEMRVGRTCCQSVHRPMSAAWLRTHACVCRKVWCAWQARVQQRFCAESWKHRAAELVAALRDGAGVHAPELTGGSGALGAWLPLLGPPWLPRSCHCSQEEGNWQGMCCLGREAHQSTRVHCWGCLASPTACKAGPGIWWGSQQAADVGGARYHGRVGSPVWGQLPVSQRDTLPMVVPAEGAERGWWGARRGALRFWPACFFRKTCSSRRARLILVSRHLGLGHCPRPASLLRPRRHTKGCCSRIR